MKPFETTAILRQPRPAVFAAIRDRLPGLADRIDDIRSIETIERNEPGPGRVQLVNIWRVKAEIPRALEGVLRQDQLAWTDRADWEEAGWTCRWRIEPHVHGDRVCCEGSTTFSEALGGRGTKVVFAGSFAVVEPIPGLPRMLQGAATAALETLVGGAIPRSFRKMVQVVENELVKGPTG